MLHASQYSLNREIYTALTEILNFQRPRRYIRLATMKLISLVRLMCGWPSVKIFSLLLVRRWCVSELLSEYFCWCSGGVDIWVATNENFLTKAHSFTSATTRMFWHKLNHTPLTTTKCFWPKVRSTPQTPTKLFSQKINHMSSLQLTQVFWYKGMSHTNNEMTFTKGKSYMTTTRRKWFS